MDSHENGTIRLGLMAPLSGLVQIYGPEISAAGEIACAEINERGGVLGRPLELVIADDGSMPDTAVPAARHLCEREGCVAIIGNLLSNSRIAVAGQVAEPRRIPYLNFSFYEGSIQGRYFFHFAALPNQQIEKMIPYMAEHFGAKMYFAGSNYEWPRGSIDAAKQALCALQGDVVGEEYLPIGASDYDALLDRLARSGADVFVPYFAGADQLNLLTRFADRRLGERMAVVMGHYDEVMVSKLPVSVRTGLFASNTYFMSVDTPENHAYLERLSRRPGIDGVWPQGNGFLTNFGEGTYVCVHAFAQAAERAGSLDADALVNALEHVSVLAPQGRVDMDPVTHHAKVNSYLARCQDDGTFAIVQRFGRIDPAIPARYHALRRSERDPHVVDPRVRDPAVALDTGDSGIPVPVDVNPMHVSDKILATADVAIVACDEDGIIRRANVAAERMFGYQSGELLGMAVHLLVPPYMRLDHRRYFRHFIDSDANEIPMGERGEIAGYRKDGSEFPSQASICKFAGPEGWTLVATLRDITQRKQAEQALVWRATHDPLTQLANRVLLTERLTTALHRSKGSKNNVALMFIDLDGFKLINDSYGHEMGDHLLVAVAERLVDAVRPGDMVARFGGDEFIVLCDSVADPEAITVLVDRILEALRRPFEFREQAHFVTASVGMALGHGDVHTAEELLRRADGAMYLAKDHGRNQWREYSDTIHVRALRQLELANGLHTAIEREQLQLYFQPIVDIESYAIVGVEALLRWFIGAGSIPPSEFIPVAESTGEILAIGRWVFEQACAAQVRWRALFGHDSIPYVSVNVSPRQLSDPGLVADFRRILASTSATADKIMLEITETALMDDVQANVAVLHELSDIGFNLAIDDFGTGYSSLGQLVELPVGYLKIDRAFVDALGTNKASRAVVAAVIRMANALDMKVIAEGVETEKQLDWLHAEECRVAQGYHFYRPMTNKALERVLLDLFRLAR